MNSAAGVASSPSGNSDTSDTSDDGDDSDGDIDDDPTIVTLTATPSIDVSKSASLVDPNNNGADLGDTIVYTITVTNTGDLTLTGVSISDTITDGNGSALSLIVDQPLLQAMQQVWMWELPDLLCYICNQSAGSR